jgi:hypothetical protein
MLTALSRNKTVKSGRKVGAAARCDSQTSITHPRRITKFFETMPREINRSNISDDMQMATSHSIIALPSGCLTIFALEFTRILVVATRCNALLIDDRSRSSRAMWL